MTMTRMGGVTACYRQRPYLNIEAAKETFHIFAA